MESSGILWNLLDAEEHSSPAVDVLDMAGMGSTECFCGG